MLNLEVSHTKLAQQKLRFVLIGFWGFSLCLAWQPATAKAVEVGQF